MNQLDKNTPGYLQGGGEMGELIRNYDWEKTSLGKPENWPHSLQTTVGIILHSAFPMFLFWGKDLLCFYNDAYRPSLGNNGKHPLIAKGGKEAWPEIWYFIGPLIEKVMTTGEAVWFEDQFLPIYRNGKIEDVYWTFSYSPAYGDDSSIQGVFVTCTETTEKVIALNELKATNDRIEKSQEELVTYFEQSPVAIATISKENLTFRLVNPFYAELVGRKPEDIENKPLLVALPELKGQGFDDLLREVISTGKAFIANEVSVELKRKGELETIYVNLAYQPQRDTKGNVKGILVVATDVTQQVNSRKKIEESGLRLKTMIDQTPAPTLVLMGDDLVVEQINEPMLQMIGRGREVIGLPLITSMPELKGQYIWDQVTKVYTEGISFDQTEVYVPHKRQGVAGNFYYNISYRPLKENGKITGMIQVAVEVTEQVLARQKIEQSEKELRELISASPIGICVLSGNPVWVEEVNERFLVIAGKTREQFETLPYWEVMKEIAHMFEAILSDVFRTGIKFTSNEHEMVLIRGGVAEKIYATFEYIPVFDANNVVTKVILMVVEVSHQVEIRKQVEDAVVLRTRELAESNLHLKRSNEELEQFAYIASHDLQEPIRKISTFTQMLEQNLTSKSDKAKDYIAKIFNSTDRMSKLIRDVLAYSRIGDQSSEFETVNLNTILEAVKVDFELTIGETQAKIEHNTLPTVNAIPSQMMQLFGNLMSNALKYRKPEVQPVIKILCAVAKDEKVRKRLALDPAKKYYHIEFSDNGIGFSKEYVDQIFRIFQRLHGKTEYEGTGIGLAICQKIVNNHGGHISAAVGENGGALFNILLPAKSGN